jgi:hypothetical protein
MHQLLPGRWALTLLSLLLQVLQLELMQLLHAEPLLPQQL